MRRLHIAVGATVGAFAVLAITASVVISLRPAAAQAAPNTIAVDADPSSHGTAETAFPISGAGTFSVGINTTIAGTAYKGYQVEIQFATSGLTAVGTSTYTGASPFQLCQGVPSVVNTPPNTFVQDSCAKSSAGSVTYVGQLETIDLQCASDGAQTIHLTTLAEDALFGTMTLDAVSAPITTLTVDATITCSGVGAGPTPTDTPIPPNTPVPTPPNTPVPAPSCTASGPTASNPTNVYAINTKVASAVCGVPVDLLTVGGRTTTVVANLGAFQTGSGGQIVPPAGPAGDTVILVKTDGSTTNLFLNGKGLTCTPACDGATNNPAGTDNYAAWTVTALGTHVVGDSFAVTATQDSVALDSDTLKVVGQARDIQLTAQDNKTTIAANTTAGACTIGANTANPSIAGLIATYTDINGMALVGYAPTFGTSAVSKLAIGSSSGALNNTSQQVTSMVQADGITAAGYDVACGIAAGVANVTATTVAGEIAGTTGTVTRTRAFTIGGAPAAIALAAAPAGVVCDGAHTSSLTARVTDATGADVPDGTPVRFSVVAHGTATPVNTVTTGGLASSLIRPTLSTPGQGVLVVVSAGDVNSSITIQCIAGPPASVTLNALPGTIVCDGTASSVVTADVRDAQGYRVENGTPVTFNVYAGGLSNPIQTITTNGSASSTITPFRGTIGGVTVIVQSGTVLSSIGVLCDPSFDNDGDGCPDLREVGTDWLTGGQRSAISPWDFFDVPTPRLVPSVSTGVRNRLVTLGDVIAVVEYIGTSSASPATQNTIGATYGSDLNHNGTQDGAEYDRTAGTITSQQWRSGPPDGIVSLGDALVVLNQVGTNCT